MTGEGREPHKTRDYSPTAGPSEKEWKATEQYVERKTSSRQGLRKGRQERRAPGE